jgi:hypothetical protein
MAALAAFLLAPAIAVPPSSAQQISPARMAEHAATLASDAFEGRQPATQGEPRTLAYIVSQYAAAGLKPAVDGAWYQPVWLISRIPGESRIAVADESLPSDALVLIGEGAAEALATAPLLFAGYAMPAALRNRRSLDGAVILHLPGAPDGVAPDDVPSLASRRSAMRSAGAAATVTIIPDKDWAGAAAALRKGSTGMAEDAGLRFRGMIRESAARSLIASAGGDYDRLRRRAARASMKPVRLKRPVTITARTTLRSFATWNVAGLLEGTTGADETVLVLAHWDHLGICRPAGADDRICNGAVDNASGIAGTIELARTLAAGPRLERSVLFLATTAEEMGLLGARAYVAQPLRPLATTVAAINLDMIALRPPGAPVAIVGRGLSTLDGVVAAAAAEQGRSIYQGQGPDAYVQRSDAYPLLTAGVPAVVATGVLASPPGAADPLLDAFFRDRYHQPADEADAGIDWTGAAQDVELAARVIRRLAVGESVVRWLPSSPYQRPQGE